MSYPIIFETKIVRLSDGRLIHFSLQGCNNDDNGRHRTDFTGKIYSESDFIAMAKSFMENSEPFSQTHVFELQIGSRKVGFYEYGEHLLRMLAKAQEYADFIRNHHLNLMYFDTVTLAEKGNVSVVSVQEYRENYWTGLVSNPLTCTVRPDWIVVDSRDEQDVVKALSSSLDNVSIFISRPVRKGAQIC